MNILRYWIRKLRDRPNRVRRRTPHDITLESAGTKAQFHIEDGTDSWLLHTPEQVEEEQRVRFLECLRPDDVVYDVGAHIGLWTVFIAKRAHQGQVHAFEPSDENRARVERNVELNDLANVSIHVQAIGDESREAEFAMFAERCSARGSLVPEEGDSRATRVEMLALDDVHERLGVAEPTAIKFDIEGAEGLALAGAERLLRGPALRVIHIEVHHQAASTGWPAERIRKHLEDRGFEELHRTQRLGQLHCLYVRLP